MVSVWGWVEGWTSLIINAIKMCSYLELTRSYVGFQPIKKSQTVQGFIDCVGSVQRWRCRGGEDFETVVWVTARSIHRCWLFWHYIPHGFRCQNEGCHDWCMFSNCKYCCTTENSYASFCNCKYFAKVQVLWTMLENSISVFVMLGFGSYSSACTILRMTPRIIYVHVLPGICFGMMWL